MTMVELGTAAAAALFLAGIVALVLRAGRRAQEAHREADRRRRSITPPAGDAWRKLFEAEGLADLIPSTEQKVRKGLRLEKTNFDGKLGSSRLGGLPDVPPDADWPGSIRAPGGFLAQINLEEVAAAWPESPLPKTGHLWFFECEGEGLVHFEPAPAPLVRASEIYGLTEHQATGIRFVPFEDVPESINGNEVHEQIREYLCGHKLLGYANGVQERPDQAKQLLLQLDTDDELGMTWGDVGRAYFLIDPQDLEHGRFDAISFEMQCH